MYPSEQPSSAPLGESKTAVRHPDGVSRPALWGRDGKGRRSFCHALWQGALLLCVCGLLLGALVLTVNVSMVDLTKGKITTVEALSEAALVEGETYDCVLVLGAGIRDDGSPSDMLYDRVTVASALYEALGDVPLLMSGDHTGSYNEVGVMKDLAITMGVPSDRIFLDHDGDSTYESLYRAKAVFGARRVVIITQGYHLYRALHIARELGMEAVGVSADLRPYRKQTIYEMREMLARFKDMFTAAKGDYEGHLDPPVDLDGNGDLT